MEHHVHIMGQWSDSYVGACSNAHGPLQSGRYSTPIYLVDIISVHGIPRDNCIHLQLG